MSQSERSRGMERMVDAEKYRTNKSEGRTERRSSIKDRTMAARIAAVLRHAAARESFVRGPRRRKRRCRPKRKLSKTYKTISEVDRTPARGDTCSCHLERLGSLTNLHASSRREAILVGVFHSVRSRGSTKRRKTAAGRAIKKPSSNCSVKSKARQMTFTRGPNWSSASSGQLPSNGEVAIPPKLAGLQSLAVARDAAALVVGG